MRRRKSACQESRFRGLVPPLALPELDRPSLTTKCRTLTMDTLNMLLNLPSVLAIIGQQFHLFDPTLRINLFYHIHGMEISPDGHKFSVQYEGTRYDHNN